MTRAFLPLLVLLGLTAAHTVAAAGGSAREGDRAVTNTFMLITAAPARPEPRQMPSNGVGIGPSKPVVSNPYQVPLLQNAGPVRGAR